MVNFKEKQVSVFNGYYENQPSQTISLHDALFHLADRAMIDEVRNTENQTERKKKKSKLPTFTPSGVFETRAEGAIPVIDSGFMCIDIDKDHNPTMDAETVKWKLKDISQVAYCGLSVSGQGLFLLIPIEKPECYRLYYEYFSEKLMQHFGLKADPACKNIGRLRVASYDDNPCINLNATVLKGIKEENRTTYIPVYQNYNATENSPFTRYTAEQVDRYIQHLQVHNIDITCDYNDWFVIGCALAKEYGEAGRERFHQVSSISPKYTQWECDKKYNNILKCNPRANITTFINKCHNAGVWI